MKNEEKIIYIGIACAYWLATVSSMAGFYFLGEVTQDANDFSTLISQRHLLSLGIFLQLINDSCVILIGLLFYRLWQYTNHGIGLVVLVTRTIEAIILLIGKLGMLSLALIAKHESNQCASLLGLVIEDFHFWSFIYGMLPLGVGGVVLSLFLLKQKGIPQVLAVLGVIGYLLLFAKSIAELFFVETTPWLFLPVAIFEFLFPFWLLRRGLRLMK